MIIAGYGETLVAMPEGSPFSMSDLVTLAYLIDSMDRGEEWTRFDYRKAEDDLWDARGGGRSTLRGRLRLLASRGLIETKTVGVEGEHGVRTFYKVNIEALEMTEVSEHAFTVHVLQC